MRAKIKNIYDNFCSIVWKIFIFANHVFAYAIATVFKFLDGFFIILCLIWPFHQIAPRIRKFFSKLYARLSPYLAIIGAKYDAFLTKVDKTYSYKRIFSPLVLIIVLLLIHPPSYWGEWRLKEQGLASYYGYGFYFNETASGEIYFPWDITAASLTLPLGTIAKVVNKNNGAVVYVRINDRGPYKKDRIIDLSFAAALKLGMLKKGIVSVDIYTKD